MVVSAFLEGMTIATIFWQFLLLKYCVSKIFLRYNEGGNVEKVPQSETLRNIAFWMDRRIIRSMHIETNIIIAERPEQGLSNEN